MTRLGAALAGSFVVLLLTLSCALEQGPSAESSSAASSPQVAPSRAAAGEAEPAPAAPPISSPRKLIRTVDLDLRVEDTDAASAEVTRQVEESGGYVANRTVRAHQGFNSYALTLRVPVDALDGVLNAIRSLAVEVTRESQRSEDVTDRFVDLDARLRTLEATERELLALLSESRSRGHGAEDIMAVYRELTEVRTRIEQLRGQLNLLESQTALSTIALQIWPTETATPVVSDRWRPLETLRRSSRLLLAALRALADLVIFLIVVVLPVAVVVGVPVLLLRRAWRRRRRRRRGGDESSEGRDGATPTE